MPTTYVSRISQWIEKQFNAKGGNVITDIDQTASVELPFLIGNEARYLQGWNLFGVVSSTPATAANFSRTRIRNPVGSNVIAILELISVYVTAIDTPFVTWGPVASDLTNLVTTTFTRIDPRGNTLPTCIVSQVAQASAGANPGMQRALAALISQDFLTLQSSEMPILPGNTIDVSCNTVNIGLTVTLRWRERALELSELT